MGAFLAPALISLGLQGIKAYTDWRQRQDTDKLANQAFKPIEYDAGQERQNLRTGTATRVNAGVRAAGRQSAAAGTAGTGQTLATERAIADVGANQIARGDAQIDQRQYQVDQQNRQIDMQRLAYEQGQPTWGDYVAGAFPIFSGAYQLMNPQEFLPQQPQGQEITQDGQLVQPTAMTRPQVPQIGMGNDAAFQQQEIASLPTNQGMQPLRFNQNTPMRGQSVQPQTQQVGIPWWARQPLPLPQGYQDSQLNPYNMGYPLPRRRY